MHSRERETAAARGLGHSLKMPACLLGGPALWLAAMVIARSLSRWQCGQAGPVLIHAVAALGCLLIAYVSLRSVRGEHLDGDAGERGWFFAAGFIAVLCMAGIGATAVASAMAGTC